MPSPLSMGNSLEHRAALRKPLGIFQTSSLAWPPCRSAALSSSVWRLLPEGVLSRRRPAAGGMAGMGGAAGRMTKEAPSGGRRGQ